VPRPTGHPTRDHWPTSPTPSADFRHTEARTRISNAERTERDAGRTRRNAVEWHDETLKSLLNHRTDQKARAGLTALLAELTAEHGLGWSGIARLVGVSVPAVRKWRRGGDITPTRLQSLARLTAFLEMLQEEKINDAAAWLSLPLNDEDAGEAVSKSDVYSAGGVVDLLAYAKDYISRDELLSRTSAQRYSTSRQARVVRAPDGRLSIVSGIRGDVPGG
jgi:hypothetical protein